MYITPALFSLTFASYVWHVQSEEQQQRSGTLAPLKPLASLLLARNPEASFNPSTQGVRFPGSGRNLAGSRTAGDPVMARQRRAATRKQPKVDFSWNIWKEHYHNVMLEAKEEEEKKKASEEVLKNIDPKQKVGKIEDYMYKTGVADILDKLDAEMIGIVKVKERVRSIASMLVIDKMRMKIGLTGSVPSLHMSFTGAPGTGKTTVALRMGQILQRMGYCRSGHVVVAQRDDLVGQYVGHTAPKTKEMVKKSMGGILLVDEAYYLYNTENERDYGQESIEILLNVMVTMPDDVIVILAGYEDLMADFFGSIPGMSSRIGHHITFPDFDEDELLEIGILMAEKENFILEDGAIKALEAYLAHRKTLPFFSNARTVRNAIDRARLAQSNRLFEEYFGGFGTKLPPLATSIQHTRSGETLRKGWVEKKDPLGKPYYVNKFTGDAQREKPEPKEESTPARARPPPAPAPAPSGPTGPLRWTDLQTLKAADIPTVNDAQLEADMYDA